MNDPWEVLSKHIEKQISKLAIGAILGQGAHFNGNLWTYSADPGQEGYTRSAYTGFDPPAAKENFITFHDSPAGRASHKTGILIIEGEYKIIE